MFAMGLCGSFQNRLAMGEPSIEVKCGPRDAELFQRALDRQGAGLAAQILHLVRGRGPRRIASQPLLPGFEKILRPAIIKILDCPSSEFLGQGAA
jgi:hypothetical protein